MKLFQRQNLIFKALLALIPILFLASFALVYAITFRADTYAEMMAHKGIVCLVDKGSCVTGSERPVIVAWAYIASSREEFPQYTIAPDGHRSLHKFPVMFVIFNDRLFRAGINIENRGENIEMSELHGDGAETSHQAHITYNFSYDEVPRAGDLSFNIGGQQQITFRTGSDGVRVPESAIVIGGENYALVSIEKSIEVKGEPFSGELTFSDGSTISFPRISPL